VAALLVLSAFAFAPLLGAGLCSWDYRELLAPGRGLGALWTGASRALHGLPLPGEGALGFRAEGVLLLLGLAVALFAFLVRLLTPWLGPEGARSAGLASALFLPLHPAAVRGIAELGARGELLALALGFLGAYLFLKGRQLERGTLPAVSLVLMLLAGAASIVAVLVALLLGAAEFSSVRRHRKRGLRLRTAATTSLLFGFAALLPSLLGTGEPGIGLGGEVRARLLVLGDQLGRLALPARDELGAVGWVFGLALLLVALQPAFHAARHAPRLWGSLLFAWSVALLVSLAWAADGARGRGLFALVVWAAGLGLTVTARLRVRRTALAFLVALGWTVLAHAEARAWLVSARLQARLRAEILALAPDLERPLLVLDAADGPLPLWREPGWLFHPRLGPEGRGDGPPEVRMLSSAAFLALTRSAAFEPWRARRTTVVVEGSAFGRVEPGRIALALEPAAPPAEPEPWVRQHNYTPEEPLDPLAWEGLELVAELTSEPEELAQLAWKARTEAGVPLLGHVAERGARRVASFDLGRSLTWRLAGSVRVLEVVKVVRPIERGELRARLPELTEAGAPRSEEDDWLFAPAPACEGLEAGGRYVLSLLALDGLELVELPLERAPGQLCARGAQRFVAAHARAGAPVAWSLEYRIDDVALFRSRGSAP
jgi:hypothetical protein